MRGRAWGGQRLVAVSDTSNGWWEKNERETGRRWPVAVSIQGEKSKAEKLTGDDEEVFTGAVQMKS
jgi:hypothetical protein